MVRGKKKILHTEGIVFSEAQEQESWEFQLVPFGRNTGARPEGGKIVGVGHDWL